MNKNIVFLGAGGWGTAMAISASGRGHAVSVWSPFSEEIEKINKSGENKLLPGILLPDDISFTTNIECVKAADIVIFAVPSFAVNDVAEKVADMLPEKAVMVSIAKGFDKRNCERLSEVIVRNIPNNPVVVLTGPSHAEEVARKIPTALVSASGDEQAAVEVREALSTEVLRIYSCDDIIGAELGGAVKNVIALSAGISDGAGLGDNTKAALMTRGLHEIVSLGIALGAKKETFYGLSGMGDLFVTCTSMHSRNRRTGMLIGQGKPVDECIKEVGTVEGYLAAALVKQMAERADVDMPVTSACYDICYNGKDPKEATYSLMTRPLRHEHNI